MNTTYHTLACFADITLDDLEISYSPRAYTWLWNMKFQRFNFPHIPATCITFVHAGGIVISDTQPPIFFCTLSWYWCPRISGFSWGIHLSGHSSCFFGYSAHPWETHHIQTFSPNLFVDMPQMLWKFCISKNIYLSISIVFFRQSAHFQDMYYNNFGHFRPSAP